MRSPRRGQITAETGEQCVGRVIERNCVDDAGVPAEGPSDLGAADGLTTGTSDKPLDAVGDRIDHAYADNVGSGDGMLPCPLCAPRFDRQFLGPAPTPRDADHIPVGPAANDVDLIDHAGPPRFRERSVREPVDPRHRSYEVGRIGHAAILGLRPVSRLLATEQLLFERISRP